MPPCTSREEWDDVPLPKSPLSTRAVRKPRNAASRAIPAPVTPPPMTSTSTGSAAIDSSGSPRGDAPGLIGEYIPGPPARGQPRENVMPAGSNGRRVAVVAGCRTPFCRSGTLLKNARAVDLARFAARELLERTSLDGAEVDAVIFGQVVPSALVPNVAREVSLLPQFPKEIPAYSLNRACASSAQVVGVGHGLRGGGAGAVQGVRGDLFGELREEAHFAGDVRHERRRNHLSEDDGVDLGAVQARALEQLARREPGQVHGPGVLEQRPRPAERRAAAGDNRDAPSVASSGHYILPRLTPGRRPGDILSDQPRGIAPGSAARNLPRGWSPSQAGGRPTTETPFSHRSRVEALESMAAEPVDVLVIGGGVTGAGIARDAALRGFRTALVDKGDFGSGTSSHSSRLVHGGIRYLEQFDFRLVLEASRERRVLLNIAPHLVRPLPFVFPVYRGGRIPGWKLRAGMWLYDLLAAFHNVRLHRWLGRKAVRRLAPGLREKDLRGAAFYYDAQTDDARLVIATMRGAARAGALVANYAAATSLLKPDGRVRGAVVRDVLSGHPYTVRALVVVNACGPWVDQLRRLDDPRAEPLLRLTKGAHVAVPRQRIAHTRAVTLTSPIDGRVMFVLPWEDLSYIGTTDTDEDASPDEVRATARDVIYLLRSANAFFPQARLSPHDVVATWAGLRPLLRPARDVAPSEASREHRVIESPSGLLTIAGGKLTTYRVMARDIVDRVATRLRGLDGRPRAARPRTDRIPLPGGEAADLEVLVKAALARGVAETTARHLVGRYGSEAAAVLNLVERDRGLGRSIVAGRPEIWAEVAHAVEREMAVRLSDVLVRRLHLFYSARDQAVPAT